MKTLKPLATYFVHCRWESPAYDERDGYTIETTASSGRGAIANARRRAYSDGHSVGRRMFFKVVGSISKADRRLIDENAAHRPEGITDWAFAKWLKSPDWTPSAADRAVHAEDCRR